MGLTKGEEVNVTVKEVPGRGHSAFAAKNFRSGEDISLSESECDNNEDSVNIVNPLVMMVYVL